MTPALTYDSATDTFRANGRTLIRVTNALRTALGDPYQFAREDDLALAQARGTAVHEGCHLLERVNFDWTKLADVDEEHVAPYLRAYEVFRREVGGELVAAEQRLVSDAWGFTGQLDLVLNLNVGLVLADLKTLKQPDPRVEAQLGGYKHLWEAHHKPRKLKRLWAVYLWPDKTPPYKVKEVTDPAAAERVFLAAVTVAHWKQTNGIK